LSRKRLLHEKGAELEMNRRSTRAANGVLPAIGLFFLAPLVAEFLLGNLPIKLLPALILLAPDPAGMAQHFHSGTGLRHSGRGIYNAVSFQSKLSETEPASA
jgi:hypothetical protein